MTKWTTTTTDGATIATLEIPKALGIEGMNLELQAFTAAKARTVWTLYWPSMATTWVRAAEC